MLSQSHEHEIDLILLSKPIAIKLVIELYVKYLKKYCFHQGDGGEACLAPNKILPGGMWSRP